MSNFIDCKDERSNEVVIDLDQVVEIRKRPDFFGQGVHATEVLYKNGRTGYLHNDCYDYLLNVVRSC